MINPQSDLQYSNQQLTRKPHWLTVHLFLGQVLELPKASPFHDRTPKSPLYLPSMIHRQLLEEVYHQNEELEVRHTGTRLWQLLHVSLDAVFCCAECCL